MVDPITNYDIPAMSLELQKLLRIQDWDVEVRVLNEVEMYRDQGDDHVQGYCTRYRHHRSAKIVMSEDYPDNLYAYNTSSTNGWLHTFIHEHLHIFLDDYCSVTESAVDESDGAYKMYESNLKLQEESLINRITRMIMSMMDIEDFLKRHRKVVILHEAAEAAQ